MMDLRMIAELLSNLRQFQAREHWTRQQLEEFQAQAVRQVRDYAYAHSPFYQQFHTGLYDAPLQELPVLTKAMLMEHFDDLVTDRAIHLQDVRAYLANHREGERYLGRYFVMATSGSTGQPGLFVVNRSEWATMMAAEFRLFAWGGIKMHIGRRVKIAAILSTSPFHGSRQGFEALQRLWIPTLYLAASEQVDTMVERLNAWQPEVLTPETRRRMVQAWGKVPCDVYGATEGVIAVESEQHQGMRLMEDLTLVEVEDQDNRPVPPGIYGDKLLITVLFRHTQPLIRYELSDSVRFAPDLDSSMPAFRLIDGVQGRVEEVLSFPAGAFGSVNVQPLVLNRIMDTLPVGGWQVVQEADGLRVLLSGVHGTLQDELLVHTVQQALREQGAIVPSIQVHHVASIPRNAAGKAPLIRSNLPPVAIPPSGTHDSENRVKVGD
jgi:phenylacetate-coenzyme A ligase PaaK-like adenylate-forming protein